MFPCESSLSKERITLQGLPTATQLAGIECVTILPAPITLFSPIVTPAKIMHPPPIQTLSLISILETQKDLLLMSTIPLAFCFDRKTLQFQCAGLQ